MAVCLAITTARTTLRPPPVEPPMAPTNMSPSNITWHTSGHTAKSSVANPVVVMTATTLNSARRSPSSPHEPPLAPRTAKQKSAAAAVRPM